MNTSRYQASKNLANIIWWRAWGGIGGLAVNTNYNKIAREILNGSKAKIYKRYNIPTIRRIIEQTHKPNSHKMRSLAILNKMMPKLTQIQNFLNKKNGKRISNVKQTRPPVNSRQANAAKAKRQANAEYANALAKARAFKLPDSNAKAAKAKRQTNAAKAKRQANEAKAKRQANAEYANALAKARAFKLSDLNAKAEQNRLQNLAERKAREQRQADDKARRLQAAREEEEIRAHHEWQMLEERNEALAAARAARRGGDEITATRLIKALQNQNAQMLKSRIQRHKKQGFI